jgi:hypothetical protein
MALGMWAEIQTPEGVIPIERRLTLTVSLRSAGDNWACTFDLIGAVGSCR